MTTRFCRLYLRAYFVASGQTEGRSRRVAWLFVMFAMASAPCVAWQFARVRRETGRAARGHRGRSGGRRAVDKTPKAVSIYDVVRGDDDGRSTVPDPDSVPDFVQNMNMMDTVPTEMKLNPKPRVPTPVMSGPIVAPQVIKSTAAMLASVEDLRGDGDGGCDTNGDDTARDTNGFDSFSNKNSKSEGIFAWSLKSLDRALDDIERDKPAASRVAWRITEAGERVVRNPTVRRGAKLTADVGLEVVKVGMKAAAPVVGGFGKFAAKQAFGAAVSGFKNPLVNGDDKKKPRSDSRKEKEKEDGKNPKKIVKLTAAEAEARRRAGKTVRKVEKKKGFFGM